MGTYCTKIGMHRVPGSQRKETAGTRGSLTDRTKSSSMRDQECSGKRENLCSGTKVGIASLVGTARNFVWLVLGGRLGSNQRPSWKRTPGSDPEDYYPKYSTTSERTFW